MGLHQMLREAEDLRTSPERLEILARSGDRDVLAAVARNHSTSAEALERLCRSQDPEVLRSLAHRQDIDAALLDRIATWLLAQPAILHAEDGTELDRGEVLERNRDVFSVAYNLAQNPRTALRTIERIIEYPCEGILHRAARREDLSYTVFQRICDAGNSSLLHSLAMSRHLSEMQQFFLAANGNRSTRIELGRNSTVLETVQLYILDLAEVEEVRAIVSNRASTGKVLVRAAQVHKDHHNHSRFSSDILRDLANHENSPPELTGLVPARYLVKTTLWRHYSEHPRWEELRTLAPECDEPLQKLLEALEQLH